MGLPEILAGTAMGLGGIGATVSGIGGIQAANAQAQMAALQAQIQQGYLDLAMAEAARSDEWVRTYASTMGAGSLEGYRWAQDYLKEYRESGGFPKNISSQAVANVRQAAAGDLSRGSERIEELLATRGISKESGAGIKALSEYQTEVSKDVNRLAQQTAQNQVNTLRDYAIATEGAARSDPGWSEYARTQGLDPDTGLPAEGDQSWKNREDVKWDPVTQSYYIEDEYTGERREIIEGKQTSITNWKDLPEEQQKALRKYIQQTEGALSAYKANHYMYNPESGKGWIYNPGQGWFYVNNGTAREFSDTFIEKASNRWGFQIAVPEEYQQYVPGQYISADELTSQLREVETPSTATNKLSPTAKIAPSNALVEPSTSTLYPTTKISGPIGNSNAIPYQGNPTSTYNNPSNSWLDAGVAPYQTYTNRLRELYSDGSNIQKTPTYSWLPDNLDRYYRKA